MLHSEIWRIRKEIIAARGHRGEVTKYDFPNVTVGCEYNEIKKCGHSKKCHGCVRESINYHPTLLSCLRTYGNPPIVKKVKQGQIIFVGTCAEDYASNKVLEEAEKKNLSIPSIKDLTFTPSIRPRTYQRVPMCSVCMYIFK